MRTTILWALLLLILVQSHAQPSPMKAADIVKAFYARYDVSGLEYPQVFLEKRAYSWFVYTYSFGSGKPEKVKRQLFYDAHKEAFQDVEFPVNTDSIPKPFTPLSDIDAYNLDVQPSFGYDGWYWDVINLYSKSGALSDDEMNSLARAYSSAANACLGKQYGDVLEADLFHAPLTINCLTEQQTNQYLALGNKAVALFQAIAARNASYTTKVGNIHMKAANELMTSYHSIMVYAQKYLDKVPLPLGLYHPDTLAKAKRLLEACPQGALFLSFGDNDFYPLMYLQAKGFRQDVYLINYSLIGMDRFIFRATKTQFKAKPVVISFDTTHYKDEVNSYFIIDESKATIPFEKTIDIIRSNKNSHYNWHFNTIILGNSKQHPGNKIKITLQGHYVDKSQWILLDILHNLDERAICFPIDFNDQLQGLNARLKRKGPLFIFRY
jgi:hypothetical protein